MSPFRSPRLCSCDPGGKPGYALTEPETRVKRRFFPAAPAVVQVALRRVDLVPGWAAAAVEGQWTPRATAKHERASTASILTLSVRAGAQVALAAGEDRAMYVLPVSVWTGWLGSEGLSSPVLYERILESLTPEESGMLPNVSNERLHDCAAAIGIGWAWGLMPARTRERYRLMVQ